MNRLARRIGVAALACIALAGLVPVAEAASVNDPPKVMTRNLYLGADLTPVNTAAAQYQGGAITLNDFMNVVADTRRYIEKTDFASRAHAIAKEIDDHDPYLIGLQEVALYRDGPIGNPAVETDVVQSFEADLMAALAARGLKYKVVAKQQEADIPNAPTSFADDGTIYFKDTRLTMHDLILARTDLPPGRFSISGSASGNYAAAIPGPLGPFLRGWTSVDVSIARKPLIRFVNTHLEAFHDGIRTAQAAELAGGALNTNKAVILVGELNSDPVASPNAYSVFMGAGFGDTGNTSPTCCYSDDLLSGSFSSRIDHILTRPGLTLSTTVVGTDPANRATTPFGLSWPSDHGGVVAGL
jgi:endonuclease/exonuclease/phosphatase family metal-dependent hydrolase